MENPNKIEEAREPERTTTVVVELDVQHHGGVSSSDLVLRADRWLKQNHTDLADRMGGTITRQAVTHKQARNISVGGSGPETTN